MTDAVGVTFPLSEGVTASFLRRPGSDPVWLMIEDEAKTLDQERPPVIFLGGPEVIDLALSRTLNDLMQKHVGDEPAYTSAPTYVAGQIWHGKPEQGTGELGKVLQARGLVARIYYGDYSFKEYVVGGEEFESLKSRLRATFRL